MVDPVLGIDLGTSSVKAGILNPATLNLDCVSIREYPDLPEQEPEVLWRRTIEAVKDSVRLFGDRGMVKAIGLTGQMHGAVLYDDDGMLIGPIITWKDEKHSTQAIIEKMKLIIADQTHGELGTDVSSGYSAVILLWIKEHEPDLFQRIAHFVLPTDFLRGKLLEKKDYATDPTNAFGTGLFNTRLNRWHEELIQEFQLPLNIFPEIHESSQIAGIISERIARLLGLQREVPIIFGGGDNQMSMLGSGLAGPDSPILLNIGTAAQISKVISSYQNYPGLDTRSYFHGLYAIVGASLAGGGSYQWLREEFRREGVDLDYLEMDELASRVPPGADGLVFCTGPTRRNPNRKRGFYGNTPGKNSLPWRARAVMEGVLMDLYAPYQTLSKDEPHDFIVGAGKGLQKSRVWPQIAADLFGTRVLITDFENAVCGAALMAALSSGGIQNLDEAVQSIAYAHEMVPEGANTNFYRGEFVPNWYAEVGAA
jgi:xylulokinase